MELQVVLPLALLALIVIFYVVLFVKCYKKCPPDKLIVVYGKKRDEKGEVIRYYKCVRGAVFVWPFLQKYAFLDLAPIAVEADAGENTALRETIGNTVYRFSVAVSAEISVAEQGAEKLCGLQREEIAALAKEIIVSQMRSAAEQGADRSNFLKIVSEGAERMLGEVGLHLLNAGKKFPV